MSAPEGRLAAGTTTEPPVPEAAAAPAETIPIETPPIETAVQLDWQSSPWEATNPPGDAGWATREWVDFSWKSQAKVWQERHARDKPMAESAVPDANASWSNKAWTHSPQSPFSLWGQSSFVAKTPPVPTVLQPEPEAPALPVPTVLQHRREAPRVKWSGTAFWD